jgi:ubiquinone/menaquinone biosynthesis C-methylase UbiE
MSKLAPDQVPEGWSRVAEGYEEAFTNLTKKLSRDALELAGVKTGEQVLDVAAGTGAFSFLAAEAGAEVVATDFAPGMIESLRKIAVEKGIKNLRAEVMDGQALALPDDTFDVSASVLGLIFFPDIPRGLAEMRRVLRPAGRCAVVVWGETAKFEFFRFFVQAIKQADPSFSPPGGPIWERLAPPGVLEKEMKAAGFSQVEVHTVTRSLDVESPAALWESMSGAAPPLKPLLESIGPEKAQAARDAFVKILEEKFAAGPHELSAEARIGIGVK